MIVSTKDAVLVMNRERSRDVKKAVEFLKQNQRSEYKRHREIYRPRGRCDVVVQTPRFNVNRITVKPGGAFSMQMHHHRAEHWVILAGTGHVTVNGKQFLLTENQSTFIPIGAEHSPKTRAAFRWKCWRSSRDRTSARTTLFVLKTSMVVANYFRDKTQNDTVNML